VCAFALPYKERCGLYGRRFVVHLRVGSNTNFCDATIKTEASNPCRLQTRICMRARLLYALYGYGCAVDCTLLLTQLQHWREEIPMDKIRLLSNFRPRKLSGSLNNRSPTTVSEIPVPPSNASSSQCHHARIQTSHAPQLMQQPSPCPPQARHP
jgi:hypothetical protein